MAGHSGHAGHGRVMHGHSSRYGGYERAPHCEMPPSPRRYHATYHQAREEPRKCKYLAIGIPGMIFTAAVYFVGGFLFVTSYNKGYPLFGSLLGVPTEFAIQFFRILGPIMFFVGLFLFIVTYSYMCKGVKLCKV